nr:EIICB-Lac [Klebsiella pneumoniae]
MKLDLIGRVISVVPWTAPAPIGGAWALGWDFRAAILVIVLACVSAIIYFPFLRYMRNSCLLRKRKRPSGRSRRVNRPHK